MKISHNIPALQAYHAINRANNEISKSSLRLSTGYKINSAKDDSAGKAISTKMRMQINSLSKSSDNSLDGMSLLQTADAALNEINNMIQRMRELSVQAANDTNEDIDREKIQIEIDALIEEINAISDRTEFNTIKLFGPKAKGLNGATIVSDTSGLTTVYSKVAGFPNGDISYTITSMGTPEITALTFTGTPLDFTNKSFALDGNVINFQSTDTDVTALIKIEALATSLGYTIDPASTPTNLIIYSENALRISNVMPELTPTIASATPGVVTAAFIDSSGTPITCTAALEGTAVTLTLTALPYTGMTSVMLVNGVEIDAASGTYVYSGTTTPVTSLIGTASTTDVSSTATASNVVSIDDGFPVGNLSYTVNSSGVITPSPLYYTMTSGSQVPVTAAFTSAAEITFTLGVPYAGMEMVIDIGAVPLTGTISEKISVQDNSSIVLQVGPSQYMEMVLDIPAVNADTLGLTGLSAHIIGGTDLCITTCDEALAKVLKIRAKFGADLNRLEFTSSSLDVTEDATKESLSRIIDTDMAEEMTNYTTQSVISQTGIAILAQANQRPQQILQLIS